MSFQRPISHRLTLTDGQTLRLTPGPTYPRWLGFDSWQEGRATILTLALATPSAIRLEPGQEVAVDPGIVFHLPIGVRLDFRPAPSPPERPHDGLVLFRPPPKRMPRPVPGVTIPVRASLHLWHSAGASGPPQQTPNGCRLVNRRHLRPIVILPGDPIAQAVFYPPRQTNPEPET
ncbi:MAG: hypothetical protein Alpg2KO_01130 [Alphaproteobacteria bacterium]